LAKEGGEQELHVEKAFGYHLNVSPVWMLVGSRFIFVKGGGQHVHDRFFT
jgi:hypothetical protein